MIRPKHTRRGCRRQTGHLIPAALLLVWSLALLTGPGAAQAQGTGPVQELIGALAPNELLYYRLSGLEAGRTLYVYMEGTSGNLDPILAVVDASQDTAALENAFFDAIQQAIVDGRDPLLAAEEAANELFLTWDDDGGGGLAAAMEIPVPAGGDYRLVVSSALSSLDRGTFGNYRLLIGLDAPEVLTGEAAPTGETIAVLDREAAPPDEAVQELTGALTPEGQFLELRDLRPGDTVYVYAQATSGDLRPTVELLNFADKPLRTANLGGQAAEATLEYTLPQGGRNYSLAIYGCCDAGAAPGEYRLLVGVNEPQVLTGQAAPMGRSIVEEPIPVQIGIKLEQIVEVDEQHEFFTAVASLQMEWTDPALAFSPETCDCVVKVYSKDDFAQFVADAGGRWPDFTLPNQQGNRWTQNRMAVVYQDGRALYYERFSTDLQVDFDFREYPFDSQEFSIHVDAIYPEDHVGFTDLEGYSEISGEHGEDEFQIGEFSTEVTSQQAGTTATTSRFTFRFGGPRHINYYLLQIFVPILLIAAVSWVTFFLRDYGRRIEVASANLLVFIAFSFSLADNYPRLGYLTFLDAVMALMFIVNAIVVAYNVWLRRLEMDGEADRAERVDSILDWVYPMSYILGAVILYLIFF
jgi:hypothetical protein